MVSPLGSLLSFGFQRNAVAEALAYLRAPLDALTPGRGLSLRAIATKLGMNESTLRTAFYTPGRGPSQRTLDRISAGFSRTDLLFSRTSRNELFVEAVRPGSRGDVFWTGERPENGKAYRMVVKVEDDPKYDYRTLDLTQAGAIDPQYFIDRLADNETFERIIWYTGDGFVI